MCGFPVLQKESEATLTCRTEGSTAHLAAAGGGRADEVI